MKASFFMSTLGTMLFSATAVLCSQEEVQKFFAAADKDTYAHMYDNIKNALISPEEINSARDSDDNSIIAAAIKAYPEAAKGSDAKKATQALFDILTLMFSKLTREQVIKLLNTENKAGMTALFIAAELDVPLKIIDLLHGKGATVVNKENKKASMYAKDPYTKKILLGWENIEGDSIILPSKERIK